MMNRFVLYNKYFVFLLLLLFSCNVSAGEEGGEVGASFLNRIDKHDYAGAYLLLARQQDGFTNPSFLSFAAKIATIKSKTGDVLARKGNIKKHSSIFGKSGNGIVWSGDFISETKKDIALNERISVVKVGERFYVNFYDIRYADRENVSFENARRLPGKYSLDNIDTYVDSILSEANSKGSTVFDNFVIARINRNNCDTRCGKATDLVKRALSRKIVDYEKKLFPDKILKRVWDTGAKKYILTGQAIINGTNMSIVIVEVPIVFKGDTIPLSFIVYFDSEKIKGLKVSGVVFRKGSDFLVMPAPSEIIPPAFE